MTCDAPEAPAGFPTASACTRILLNFLLTAEPEEKEELGPEGDPSAWIQKERQKILY
jgi:hypothetical protein